MGALSPKQRDFRRSVSRRPPKGPPKSPKPQQPYRHLMVGKPLVLKRKGEFNFTSSSAPNTKRFPAPKVQSWPWSNFYSTQCLKLSQVHDGRVRHRQFFHSLTLQTFFAIAYSSSSGYLALCN